MLTQKPNPGWEDEQRVRICVHACVCACVCAFQRAKIWQLSWASPDFEILQMNSMRIKKEFS